eukprot:CAMPEP_0204089242 /NCGR_PEP_ID=MMETSP0360-20130528/187490_1 /ASSEMBLY_ACC=CAM_ASM_000342 /TAXON_ID=268821 /ORGANISM="Scrippsiella Hangoei, Strain SHTV-5" /LENGTH=184 /DNA_ID=CAMNT_0051038467 /DNA_START=1 /DNA_END=551 /DNA_ORIENTATION=-
MAPAVSVKEPCQANEGDRPLRQTEGDRVPEQPRATPPAPFPAKVRRQFTPLTYRVQDEKAEPEKNDVLKKPVICRERDRQRHAGTASESTTSGVAGDASNAGGVQVTTVADLQVSRSFEHISPSGSRSQGLLNLSAASDFGPPRPQPLLSHVSTATVMSVAASLLSHVSALGVQPGPPSTARGS